MATDLFVVGGPRYGEDMRTNKLSRIQKIAAATAFSLLFAFGASQPAFADLS
jgi:hypothetical protein